MDPKFHQWGNFKITLELWIGFAEYTKAVINEPYPLLVNISSLLYRPPKNIVVAALCKNPKLFILIYFNPQTHLGSATTQMTYKTSIQANFW